MKIKKQANALRVPPLKKAIKVKRKSSDPEDASAVNKALENVKKVLEKKNEAPKKLVAVLKEVESFEDNQQKKQRKPRGIVYVGHVPHGFFEEQMREYFSQFGTVTRVRVARSKNTGKSRGYGYIEFLHPDVAKIASETMNNYLMCGRLLKAMYIPPEKQHERFFVGKAWTEDKYPKLTNRNRITRQRNSKITDTEHKRYVRRTLLELSALEKKLKEKGIELKFQPVDVPEC